jgi:hypothetical protein
MIEPKAVGFLGEISPVEKNDVFLCLKKTGQSVTRQTD